MSGLATQALYAAARAGTLGAADELARALIAAGLYADRSNTTGRPGAGETMDGGLYVVTSASFTTSDGGDSIRDGAAVCRMTAPPQMLRFARSPALLAMVNPAVQS